jgi:peptidyl-prolyl cis-trans isomerase D
MVGLMKIKALLILLKTQVYKVLLVTLLVVPTQFGFHIIEVLNVSKTRHNSYTVAQISKLIAPSGETTQEYYKIASDFLWQKPNWLTRLIKAVETDKLNKRIAEGIKEGDKALPGLESAKDLVRWVYKAKKGVRSLLFLNLKIVLLLLN